MRPILVPSRVVTLPAEIVVRPHAIDLAAWQAHLVKHPLGVQAVRDRGPWNTEGWDATVPQVVTREQREDVAARIVALAPGGERCAVRELRGGRSTEAEPCYTCGPSLIDHCAALLDEAGVGQRYAAVIDAVLAEVAAPVAVVVPRPELTKRLIASLGRPAWIAAGTVLGVGLVTPLSGRPVAVARINRGDGTRVELRLDWGSWKWRTCYRVRQVSVGTQWSFLMDHPRPEPSLPLSEMYVVPRRWWEAYGT